jgi:hypothetical protein
MLRIRNRGVGPMPAKVSSIQNPGYTVLIGIEAIKKISRKFERIGSRN